jgi:hypothetical protein
MALYRCEGKDPDVMVSLCSCSLRHTELSRVLDAGF